MRFIIVGVGAIGGVVGGRLIEAGHDVIGIARGAHAAEIAKSGLRLACPTGAVVIKLMVVTRPAEIQFAKDDIVLLAVKGQDTVAVLEAVVRAAGIDFASADEDRERRGNLMRLGPVDGEARGGGSSWQSLARGGTGIETDYLNGEIILLGRENGIPTPVNERLQQVARHMLHTSAIPGSVDESEILMVQNPVPEIEDSRLEADLVRVDSRVKHVHVQNEDVALVGAINFGLRHDDFDSRGPRGADFERSLYEIAIELGGEGFLSLLDPISGTNPKSRDPGAENSMSTRSRPFMLQSASR